MRERVEVRKLPAEEEREKRQGPEWVVDHRKVDGEVREWQEEMDGIVDAGPEPASTSRPAHEGRDGTDDSAEPCVRHGPTLHPGVRAGVEGDVSRAKEGCGGVDHDPKQGWARDAGGYGKG